MMRKLLLLLLSVLPAALWADNVPQQRARALAERFFERRGVATRSGSVVLQWDGESDKTRSSAEPTFYLYTHSSGGFVIVAGDDCVEPILGYSTDGTYDASNLNMRNWMLEIRDGINYLRSQGREAAPDVKAQWSDGSAAQTRAMTTRSSKSYETAQWNQDTPYNDLCPTLDGKKVYTGCVATATAIAMRYHKYPASGTGTLPDYTYEDLNKVSRTIKGHALGHTYDWDNMPLTDGGSIKALWSDAQKKAVAQLMKDCGVMLNMQYNVIGSNGSGAYTSDIPAALNKYMKYDASMHCHYRSLYTHDEWLAKVRRNLDEFGPTIYSGSSDQGGHCFVLDGYDDKGNFHINWGWGGSGNGYFTFPNFDGFNTWHEAVFGMKPDAGGSATPMLGLWFDPENNYTGIHVSTEKIVPNVAFTFSVDFIYNTGPVDFTGSIAFALADKDNNVKEVLYKFATMPVPLGSGYDIPTQKVTITKAIAPGDRLKCFYSNGSGTTDWKPVLFGDEEGLVGEILLAQPIDENTSFAYNVDNRTIEVNTLAGVTCKLVDAQNREVEITADTSVTDRTVLKIDTKKLAAGTYRLTIQNDNDSKTIDFTVGGDK